MATDLDILVLGNCVMEKQKQINFNLDMIMNKIFKKKEIKIDDNVVKLNIE